MLNKTLGPIVFLGSMNAMPMMYALELKKRGFDVIYFVDRPKSDVLSRPENHFPTISLPYPEWILRLHLASQILPIFTRTLFCIWIIIKIKLLFRKTPQAYILNGFFISLAKSLKSTQNQVIALTHGSDLDVWADLEHSAELADRFHKRSIFKFLPKFISKPLIQLAVKRQFIGFKTADIIITFPLKFNETADRVIHELRNSNKHFIYRYDVSFYPLDGVSREYIRHNKKLIIFSGVRFLFRDFTADDEGYSKGNDKIIEGLAKYHKINNAIEIHFVEKGPDVAYAKKLCSAAGLTDVVIWHREMPFYDLVKLYDMADICFDQVGPHWVGAIGAYALYLGIPLIANDERAVVAGVWPDANPIQRASDGSEVYEALVRLSDPTVRRILSTESKRFVETYMTPARVIDQLCGMS